MKFKKWNIHTPADQDVARLREAGYPYLLSTVLAARGITTAEEAAEFLKARQSAEGELSDDELDAVAGGGCGTVEDAKNSTSVPPSAGLVATIMNVCG